MSELFAGATYFNANLSKWDVKNVVKMDAMVSVMHGSLKTLGYSCERQV